MPTRREMARRQAQAAVRVQPMSVTQHTYEQVSCQVQKLTGRNPKKDFERLLAHVVNDDPVDYQERQLRESYKPITAATKLYVIAATKTLNNLPSGRIVVQDWSLKIHPKSEATLLYRGERHECLVNGFIGFTCKAYDKNGKHLMTISDRFVRQPHWTLTPWSRSTE